MKFILMALMAASTFAFADKYECQVDYGFYLQNGEVRLKAGEKLETKNWQDCYSHAIQLASHVPFNKVIEVRPDYARQSYKVNTLATVIWQYDGGWFKQQSGVVNLYTEKFSPRAVEGWRIFDQYGTFIKKVYPPFQQQSK